MATTAHAVPPPQDWPDQSVAWHYGDPFGEQRAVAEGKAVVDRSNLAALKLSGPERLVWLNKLVTQKVDELPALTWAQALILDTHGHVEHHLSIFDTGEDATWLVTEPGKGAALLDYLSKMVFWAQVVPEAALDQQVLTVFDNGARYDHVLSREAFDQQWAAHLADGFRPVGTWAHEALRVAELRPRLGMDTDERTLPHEVGWVNPRGSEPSEWRAVHLDKGCYRGQETVAKVANVGRAPRHLALVHLDGESDEPAQSGAAILDQNGSVVGRLGTVAHHFELGMVGLGLVKRNVSAADPLTVTGRAAVVDPDLTTGEEEHKPGRDAVAKWRSVGKPAPSARHV